MELLSIIVPVYNSKKYLDTCLDSLVSQTYTEKEVILVDDGSTDGSSEICDRYADQYYFVRVLHKENNGVGAARNIGLREAHGEYITFVDSDDCLDFDSYRIMMSALIQTKSDVVACGYKTEYKIHFFPKKTNISVPSPFIYNSPEECLKGIGGGANCLSGFVWNKIIRKNTVQGIYFKNGMPMCEDLCFVYEVMANASRACYIDLALYHYRYVTESLSKTSSIVEYIQCLEGMKELIHWAENHAEQCLDSIYSTYIFWNTKTCEQMLKGINTDAYEQVRRNIMECKEHISKCGFRIRLLAYSIMESWKKYSFWGRFFWGLKKIYVFLHR